MIEADYIIIGQGIAGSLVAHFLLELNKKIIVIDKSYPNSASNIAAGVVNPITGRRMVKSWMIDDLLPFAIRTYKELENKLGITFFYEQEIIKLFTSEEDIGIWSRKCNDPEYIVYLGDVINPDNKLIIAPFGAGTIRGGCWMDVPAFIGAYRNFLKKNNLLIEDEFNNEELHISDTVRYKNIIARKIIFCEGYKAYQNPYFSFIPFSIAKGEFFIIHSEALKTNKILNKNIFIIPKGNDTYNVGSTFVWDDLDETVTESGRAEISDKLKRMIACPYTIIEEKAGIRPTMLDRRPVIGPHPTAKLVYIFNGLGTKGVSLSPYFAHLFAGKLDSNSPFPDEISVNRFAG